MTILTPCREYQGTRHTNGYGMRHGKPQYRFGTPYVHRQVWVMAYGPIPDGLVVMHACDNPACFRIDHLSLGTPEQNFAEMRAKGRHKVPEPRRLGTHCRHGHELTPGNIYTSPQGERSCRECRLIRHRARRKAARP